MRRENYVLVKLARDDVNQTDNESEHYYNRESNVERICIDSNRICRLIERGMRQSAS